MAEEDAHAKRKRRISVLLHLETAVEFRLDAFKAVLKASKLAGVDPSLFNSLVDQRVAELAGGNDGKGGVSGEALDELLRSIGMEL